MSTGTASDRRREAERSGAEAEASLAAERRTDLRTLLGFCLYVLAVENLLVAIWAWAAAGRWDWPDVQAFRIYGVAMLCSAAASFVGGLVGFLFGIPRTEFVVRDRGGREDAPEGHDAARIGVTAGAGDQAPRMRVNTNLEDVSDGLTKALLGIGLSQISNIGEWTRGIADALGPSFGGGAGGKLVGVSVLAYGGFTGFFFGYLATRIYLTGAFSRADPARHQIR